jgi:hypothetical protein
MTRPLLDLVHERIAHGLQEARASTLLHFVGAWLGVMNDHPGWKQEPGIRRYQDVAEAGIAFAVCGGDDLRNAFHAGLAWLQERKFFIPDRPPTLEGDPLALLALTIGVDALGEPQPKAWLMDILRRACGAEQDTRRADLLRVGMALLESTDEAWNGVSPLLRATFAVRGKAKLTQETWEATIAAVMTPDPVHSEWSVFYAAAMKTIFAAQPTVDLTRPTVEQIVEMLRLVPAALKRWPWEDKPKTKHAEVTAQRWRIQHEYHVQSLLWAVLRPIFPDLEDEENLPSLGPKHPRADLLVPSLRLVIEAKYLREATQAARAGIIEEVSADTGLYLSPASPCDQIVVFVWDATASTHYHDEINSGLRKLKGIVGVIIVSRPGEWA